jgi:hypothetical protein
MLERVAAAVSYGIDVWLPIVASSKEAPAIRIRENVRRNIQPLLGPKPWRGHRNVLKTQARVYPMSSTIERSFEFDRVIIVSW